ncbi:MAG: phosphate ABC transporter permease subunit PstC [Candidatus Coatesbacteria bacterium]|nr:phosphate ABC transporter permease subunit PstC [Candidatus Coatesbacteria bacterium]
MTKSRKGADRWVRSSLLVCASTCVLLVLAILASLVREGLPAVWEVPLSSFLSTVWRPISFVQEQFGIAPLFLSSLLVTVVAAVIAVPLGLGSAIYISHVARPAEKEILKPTIEILAGIPSVVLGFFGLMVMAPVVKKVFGLDSGLCALTGSLLLAFMALPTIITIAEDALTSVPKSYVEASLAVGASRAQTVFRTTVPAARSGLVAASLMGIGRVIGETMAVMMVTGNAIEIPGSVFDPVRTMTATIASEMGEVAFGGVHYHVLFLIGVILVIIAIAINWSAQRVLKRSQVTP